MFLIVCKHSSRLGIELTKRACVLGQWEISSAHHYASCTRKKDILGQLHKVKKGILGYLKSPNQIRTPSIDLAWLRLAQTRASLDRNQSNQPITTIKNAESKFQWIKTPNDCITVIIINDDRLYNVTELVPLGQTFARDRLMKVRAFLGQFQLQLLSWLLLEPYQTGRSQTARWRSL